MQLVESADMKLQIRLHLLKKMHSSRPSKYKSVICVAQGPAVVLNKKSWNLQLPAFHQNGLLLLFFSKFQCLVPPLEVFHDQVQAVDY